MSQITRCPQCSTLFKLEPDQLADAQGWVRCGLCKHVFDTALSVIVAATIQPLMDAEPAADATRVDLEGLLRRKDIETAPHTFQPSAKSDSASADVSAPQPSPSPKTLPSALKTEPETLSPSRPQITSVPFKLTWPNSGIKLSLQTLKFGVPLLLVLCVCLQVMLHARHELAARWPSAQAWLAAVCLPLQCKVEPLRLLRGMVIDNSSFARSATGFDLNLTLRNATDLPLAMTSLELTLTDSQDRVIFRRVLRPSDFGASAVIDAGQVFNTVLLIEPVSDSADIAGYRLVSFYP
jgi:predicted Zn finger-like uncharacterized protein